MRVVFDVLVAGGTVLVAAVVILALLWALFFVVDHLPESRGDMGPGPF